MHDAPVISPKKLIEVALPLDEINVACAREKSIRHGHPSTLHLWWARRPLAAARAVIFSQLVNDPEDLWRCQNPGIEPNKQVRGHWTKARARLFKVIEDIVLWENTTNEEVLEKARQEIRQSWIEVCELNKEHPQAAELFDPNKMPGLHDPFAGGGSIPLEAQRLGLEAYASDLNPVAVLINKAMIEIPPKFAGQVPVSFTQRHKDTKEEKIGKGKKGTSVGRSPMIPGLCDLVPLCDQFPGARGLAEDVRYYGQWMRDEAFKRIGHLYPPIEITDEMVAVRPDLEPYRGKKLTVIAWLWARTVKSPNPAFSHVDVPLASTFILSSKPGKEAYVQPIFSVQPPNTSPPRKQGIDPAAAIDDHSLAGAKGESLACESGLYPYRFTVKVGKPPAEAKAGTSAGKRKAFRCLMSDSPMDYSYIREQGKAGHMGQKLMAIVAEGTRGRVYLPPTQEMQSIAESAEPTWRPDCEMPKKHRNFQPPVYGMNNLGDLFTSRQLVALTTFSDLVGEARERIRADAIAAGLADDNQPLDTGGTEARAYAEAVSVYLAFAVSRMLNYSATLCVWSSHPKDELVKQVFMRQALPMTWDFGETNPFSSAGGTLDVNLLYLVKCFAKLPSHAPGTVIHADARTASVSGRFVSTDPPYYDNVG